MPRAEIETLAGEVRARPDRLDPQAVTAAYRALGLPLDPDPFGDGVTRALTAALGTGTPFSAIRIGDGEAAYLAYGAGSGTPALDRHAFEASVLIQSQRFRLTPAWMTVLGDLMHAAVEAADIVGVIGVWRPEDRAGNPDDFVALLKRDLRGGSGQWRACDGMLRRAQAGGLAGKTVASAYFYLGLIARIDALTAAAERTLCITSRPAAIDGLRARRTGRRIQVIATGATGRALPAEPGFLDTMHRTLPDDLRGTLCLVGAGPWSEIYCTWIKRRGGVAVDIGSGFDLLDGAATRSVHHTLSPERRAAYAALGAPPR